MVMRCSYARLEMDVVDLYVKLLNRLATGMALGAPRLNLYGGGRVQRRGMLVPFGEDFTISRPRFP